MKTSVRLFVTVTLMFLGLVLLPKARAVVPPPDGGYPGFNTAEGQNALFGLTTGALLSNTIGHRNTANGVFAFLNNTEGFGNTATGANALLSNTPGRQNP